MTLKSAWPWLLGALIIGALTAAIAIYIYHFGASISNVHTRWGEMGAAMAGIYAPTIGLLTLCVLFLQYRSSREQTAFIKTQYMAESTAAGADEVISHLRDLIGQQQARSAITTVKTYSLETLDAARNSTTGQLLVPFPPSLADEWVRLFRCVTGLAASEDVFLRLCFARVMNKAMMQLGLDTCRAFDAIAYVHKKDIPFIFYAELKEQ